MALSTCRECGSRVSTEAVSCPHCGAPRPASGRPEEAPRAASPVAVSHPELRDAPGRGSNIVIALSPKSVGLAILLAFLFGPLGMLYSTVVGATVMFLATLLVGFVTLGFGLLVTWPICVIWAAMATAARNKKLLGSVAPGAVSEDPATTTAPVIERVELATVNVAEGDGHSGQDVAPEPLAAPSTSMNPWLIVAPAVIVIGIAGWAWSHWSQQTAMSRAEAIQPPATPSGSVGSTVQRAVTLDGTISQFQCGDNCYLTITDSTGKEHSGLCLAPLCNAWTAVQEMPRAYLRKRVRAVMGKGKQYDGDGNVVRMADAFSAIEVSENAPAEPPKEHQASSFAGIWREDSESAGKTIAPLRITELQSGRLILEQGKFWRFNGEPTDVPEGREEWYPQRYLLIVRNGRLENRVKPDGAPEMIHTYEMVSPREMRICLVGSPECSTATKIR